MSPSSSTRAASRWVTRIIPVLLAGVVIFVTYVFVSRLCHTYLLSSKHRTREVIAILILYFFFLLLALAAYLRLLFIVKLDPGLVPLGRGAVKRRDPSRSKGELEAIPYDSRLREDYARTPGTGIESFYSRDIFVCESDGLPRWCAECMTFKPDRSHHSSELGRCVYKMDHFCPWVGGMVAENSFKFFVQFNVYTTCFCTVVLGPTASALKNQIEEHAGIDAFFIALIALSAFFGTFTFMMAVSSLRHVLLNLTTVDGLGARERVYLLAVRANRDVPRNKFNVITYPLAPLPHERSLRQDGEAHEPITARDLMATRTFAVVRTNPGENPWHLGYRGNWESVMGSNILDWMLPIRRSPCVTHESMESFYRTGPVIQELRERYGLSPVTDDETDQIELRDLRTRQGGN